MQQILYLKLYMGKFLYIKITEIRKLFQFAFHF